MKAAVHRLSAALVASIALLTAASAGARDLATPRLNIYAAASLTEVLQQIDSKQAYNLGGSNRLAVQIRQGAPADVFASASPDFTQALFRARLVERPQTFASNRLVLAVPKSNPAGLHSVFDLKRKDVKLVIGSARVPIGSYTRQVLRRLGLTSVLGKVVSEEPDVKSVVGKLALGEADAGFVYRTDVKAVAGRVTAIAIPARSQPKVRYEVAVLRASKHKTAARAWIKTLRKSARARRLLRQAGYGLR
jgi:molybdate transport system substrate-binding protein